MLTITSKWGRSDYQQIYDLIVGQVIKFDSSIEFETVIYNATLYKPINVTSITLTYCPPGSELYGTYGANSLCITALVKT